MRFKVALNGTDENPYYRFGLSQNPFAQDAKYSECLLRVQKLGGDPIPNEEYIRETLKGFSEEFIDGCCERFRKGEYVEFFVEFPD